MGHLATNTPRINSTEIFSGSFWHRAFPPNVYYIVSSLRIAVFRPIYSRGRDWLPIHTCSPYSLIKRQRADKFVMAQNPWNRTIFYQHLANWWSMSNPASSWMVFVSYSLSRTMYFMVKFIVALTALTVWSPTDSSSQLKPSLCSGCSKLIAWDSKALGECWFFYSAPRYLWHFPGCGKSERMDLTCYILHSA